MEDPAALHATLQDVVFMEAVGLRPVLVWLLEGATIPPPKAGRHRRVPSEDLMAYNGGSMPTA